MTRTHPLAELPHPHRLFDLGPHNGAHRVAIRAGISVGTPLLILWSIGHVELALYSTFGAFVSLYGRSHSHVIRARLQSGVAIGMVGAVSVGAAVSLSEQREWLVLPATAAYAAVITGAAQRFGWKPTGALFPVFALSATASIPGSETDALLAAGTAAASAAFALIVGIAGLARPAARDFERRARAAAAPTRPESPRVSEAVGVGLVVGVAGLIPTALGLDYPYWAMVAAAAALATSGPDEQLVRAGHRLTGTIAGVGVAWLIMSVDLPPIVTIAVICVLQMCAELFVVRNYGLALVFVTPLALVMLDFAHPQPDLTLLLARILETAIGVAVVIAAALAWRWAEHPGRRR
ncbi:FUSC family protein [Pseudoclavibacter terrae]|uniref:FUSC family protein n=1 Tax=Pseudoclavibacter terrae TaxID=1530195 RepID=A0A7J5AXY1_9MICO|nr:FUSC family protein [Pseudoclavibacter terrae]KAB1636215.1 FUSC family protein [Pseudoclavibacter terrae]